MKAHAVVSRLLTSHHCNAEIQHAGFSPSRMHLIGTILAISHLCIATSTIFCHRVLDISGNQYYCTFGRRDNTRSTAGEMDLYAHVQTTPCHTQRTCVLCSSIPDGITVMNIFHRGHFNNRFSRYPVGCELFERRVVFSGNRFMRSKLRHYRSATTPTHLVIAPRCKQES